MKPIIFGFSGTSLTAAEEHLFADANPFGFILFQRNIESPDQVRRLLEELKTVIGRVDIPVFIDQEGGKAARLKPPHWPKLPAMREIGKVYERDAECGIEAMQLHARITAHMLRELGIICNLAPVLDLYIEGANQVIGSRALSDNPETLAKLGRVAVDTYLKNGVLPCIKHLPGHGRFCTDPHHTEAIIDTQRDILETRDFVPFIALRHAPVGMNSHAIFSAIDSALPASLSPTIHEIIRNDIGFEGVLLSDDMTMKAFNDPRYGTLEQVAACAIEAGTDIVLHCNGKIEEMRSIAAALPEMSKGAKERWERAKNMVNIPFDSYHPKQDISKLDVLVSRLC